VKFPSFCDIDVSSVLYVASHAARKFAAADAADEDHADKHERDSGKVVARGWVVRLRDKLDYRVRMLALEIECRGNDNEKLCVNALDLKTSM